MGSARTLFAVSVVFAHSYGCVFVGGTLAVPLFFVISGYLISYILVEAKTYKTKTAFYYNRFLRLFPLYWIVTVTTLLAVVLAKVLFGETHQIISTFSSLNWDGRIALIFANLFILGQDWIMFSGVQDGNFKLVLNFKDSSVDVYRGLIAPQAWALGVELNFYLLAPLILTRKKLMLNLFLASVLLKAYLMHIEISFFSDPWKSRFFPTEISFFLFGACSHQFWKPWLKMHNLMSEFFVTVISYIFLLYCIIYCILPFKNFNAISLLILLFLSLPLLFKFQASNSWDKKIGELSYPIYISHMLVVWTIGFLTEKFGIDYKSFLGSLIILFFTFVISYFLNISVGRFLEKQRNQVKKMQKN